MHYAVTDVHAHMVQAVSTLKRLPQHVLRGYISSWPEIAFERTEHGRGPAKIKIPPKARETTETDEAIRWLAWVPVLDRQVIWDMADAPPTRVFAIARQNGLSEAEVGLAWKCGLGLLETKRHATAAGEKVYDDR